MGFMCELGVVCRPVEEGGIGFDYRLQMAIADKWIEVRLGHHWFSFVCLTRAMRVCAEVTCQTPLHSCLLLSVNMMPT